MFKRIEPANTYYYRYGIDDYPALKTAMAAAMAPILEQLKEAAYWTKPALDWAEYKSRDGFIPHTHNQGGPQVSVIIPRIEADSVLPSGSITDCTDFDAATNDYVPSGENHECDEHCEHMLSIWMKFEGVENGVGTFYLVASAGNEDAPYFRPSKLPTVFESEFEARNVREFKEQARIAVAKLFKSLEWSK